MLTWRAFAETVTIKVEYNQLPIVLVIWLGYAMYVIMVVGY